MTTWTRETTSGTSTETIPLPAGVTANDVTNIISDLKVLKGFYDK